MRVVLSIVAMAIGLGVASPLWAREPLLMPGKPAGARLYQRVISHPQAKLYPSPAAATGAAVKPFTPLYVYQRQPAGGVDWLEVSVSTDGRATGWLRSDQASEWRQALTLRFTDRSGRLPVLFFRDRAALEEVAGSGDATRRSRQLADQAQAIKASHSPTPANFPLVAAEPTDSAVAAERFYLLPIFETAEPFVGVKLLKVASIDPGNEQPSPQPTKDLKTGIVFVMDTTISMRPYIERSRAVVQKVYDDVERAGLADKVAFGLVAFRSNVTKTPGLDYTAKKIMDLTDATRRREFESKLSALDEARVSSHAFDEDAFAGLRMAIEEMNWGQYSSRVIILVTDAGAIRADDPWSSTGMNEDQLRELAAAKGITPVAVHLMTPSGRRANNHTPAATQYHSLTRTADADLKNLYTPVDGGDVTRFGTVTQDVADGMVRLATATARGERLPAPQPPSGPRSVEEETRWKTAALGYAMQLDFFGRRDHVSAPELRVGWVADKDVTNPATSTFQVCVLLTKDQLSQLNTSLQAVMSAAKESNKFGTRDFFQRILTAAAQMTRDPTQFTARPGATIQELGVLGAFLDDLPYKSAIMRMSEDDWNRMSFQEQQTFINSLRSKLRLYAEFDRDQSNWHDFGSARPGDAVFRIPLTELP